MNNVYQDDIPINSIFDMIIDGTNGSFKLDIDKIESINNILPTIERDEIIENLQQWMINTAQNHNCNDLDLETSRIQTILPTLINSKNIDVKNKSRTKLIESIDMNIRFLGKIVGLLKILEDNRNMIQILKNVDNYINQYLQNKSSNCLIKNIADILHIDIDNTSNHKIIIPEIPNSLKFLVGFTNTLSRFWELLPFAYFRNKDIFYEMGKIYFKYNDIFDNIINIDFLEYYIKNLIKVTQN